jgi:hypothetical protein
MSFGFYHPDLGYGFRELRWVEIWIGFDVLAGVDFLAGFRGF